MDRLQPDRDSQPKLGWVALIYFASGAAALIIETTWLRWFRLLLGATAPAASATLAGFFTGHALGAALGARFAPRWRRPLAVYGTLELLAALGALAVPLLVIAGETLTASLYDRLREQFALLTAFRFGLALVATLPAAICFGATLPAVGAAVVRHARALGSGGSALYGINTLGAAVGTALAAFVLPEWIGVRSTYALGMGLLVLAGLGALALARGEAPTPAAAARDERALPRTTASELRPPGRADLLGYAALSGFGALAAQVLLIQAFAQVVNHTVYAFGAVLVTVLTTLAIGAAAVAAVERRGGMDPRTLLGGALAFGALALAGFPALLEAATNGFEYLRADGPWPAYLIVTLRITALTSGPLLLTAALVLPATFAVAGRSEAEETGAGTGRAGVLLGRLAAANTLGAIAGALAAPFLLLPMLGLWTSFGALALVFAAGSFSVAEPRPSRRLVRHAALIVGAVGVWMAANPLGVPPVRVKPGESVVAYETSASGVVAVIEKDGDRIIRTNNHYSLGGTSRRRYEERQGHLPLLLHPHARSVAYVGTATGITAGASVAHPVETIHLVEIVPDVARVAQRYFGHANRGVYTNPRTRVALDDARNFLRATHERFDVVVADLFVPWRLGTASLYSLEHFQSVRTHLAPDGIFVQWLPLYQLSAVEFEIIARTFFEVFPTAAIFRGDFYGLYPVVGLVGYAGRPAPAAAVSQAALRLREAGEEDRWVTDPVGVWSLYVAPLAPRAAELGSRRINTDDTPRLEFLAARTHTGQRGKQDPLVGMAWTRLAEGFRAAALRAGADVYRDLPPEARRASEGGAALQTASALYVAGRTDLADRAFQAASERIPPHLVADAPPDESAADVWHDRGLPVSPPAGEQTAAP